jgi:hypothetical protein
VELLALVGNHQRRRVRDARDRNRDCALLMPDIVAIGQRAGRIPQRPKDPHELSSRRRGAAASTVGSSNAPKQARPPGLWDVSLCGLLYDLLGI